MPQLNIRLSAEELARLKQKANDNRTTTSQLLRDFINAPWTVHQEEPKEPDEKPASALP